MLKRMCKPLSNGTNHDEDVKVLEWHSFRLSFNEFFPQFNETE